MLNLEDQYDRIFKYLYFHFHDRHVAEDMTQEAFLRFLISISRAAILSDFRKQMVDERAPVCYKNGMSIGALLLSERRTTGGRDTKKR